jgi:hypothetical protein
MAILHILFHKQSRLSRFSINTVYLKCGNLSRLYTQLFPFVLLCSLVSYNYFFLKYIVLVIWNILL